MTGSRPYQSTGPSHPKAILATYLGSLRAPGSKRVAVAAILLYYGGPLALSALVYLFGTANTQVNWSAQGFSIFAIFLGLLISVQLSVFSIYNRFRTAAHDEFGVADEAEMGFATTELKRMNSLISYLNLISVVAMSACMVLAVANAPVIIQEAVVLSFYAHFLLNAFLLLRRGHVLFQKGFG
jgi:hypothetical protein